MSYVVFDTETSGLFNFKLPADAPGQPRLASAAFIFLDENLEIEREHTVRIAPEGWSMSAGATSVNGLTDAMLKKEGLPVGNVLRAYNHLIDQGVTFIAHNAEFDLKVFRAELRRAHLPDRYAETKSFCTMRSMTNVCQLSGPRGYKWPKLIEAYRHLFGEDFENAHDALADARACAKIFKRMMEYNLCEIAA